MLSFFSGGEIHRSENAPLLSLIQGRQEGGDNGVTPPKSFDSIIRLDH